MRAASVVILSCVSLAACDDPGADEAAWSGGPAGHVYVNAGPLYDLDARDGRILRELPEAGGAKSIQATSDHAYFIKSDAGGTGRVFQLGLDADVPTQLGDVSNTLVGVSGDQVIGVKNDNTVIRTNLTTGAVTMSSIPGAVACGSGSITAAKLYLACTRFAVGGTDAGLIVHDLTADTFGAFIVVKTGVMPLSAVSNVTATPAGVVFFLYEGTVSVGTRTAYAINGATVGPPIVVPGVSDDLDEQAAIGDTIYLTLYPANQVVPFDVSTMTVGTPIAIDQPRHIRAGGGNLWVAATGLDGTLARVVPSSGEISFRTFNSVTAGGVDSLAYGE